jgi:hypothetical protein
MALTCPSPYAAPSFTKVPFLISHHIFRRERTVHTASRVSWWRATCGLALLATGAAADGFAGWAILTGGDLRWLLLHVVAILFSVQGLSLCLRGSAFLTLLPRFRRNLRSASTGTGPSGQRATTTIWLLFFVGLGTFPGCGLIACGLASGIIRLYDRHAKTGDHEEKSVGTDGDEEQPAVPNLQVEPLVHSLYDADLEARRAAVAELGRLGSASAIELLRQLLTDPSAEVRHDASVMLTRLENELIQPLNATLALWEADAAQPQARGAGTVPGDRAYLLAEQYYRYAESNVLDTPSQHPYLLKARELLTEVLARNDTHTAALTLRARVHLRLNEPEAAQQDAVHALKFQPADADLTLLALESAYCARDWETLSTLARDTLASVTENAAIHQIAHSWATIS